MKKILEPKQKFVVWFLDFLQGFFYTNQSKMSKINYKLPQFPFVLVQKRLKPLN